MAPILYSVPGSPPVRAVLMTAKSIGLNLDVKEIDLQKGEHKTPEYLKLNPQHTVPTLVDDDGFVIWDSHAIMPYLISKYAKDDALYPRDPKKRAVIDQRLHFDSAVAFARLLKTFRPVIYFGKKTIDPEDHEAIDEIYDFLEAFLEGREWVAGDAPSIADYSLVATISSVEVVHPVDSRRNPRLAAWLKRAETWPVYDVNKKGLDALAATVKAHLA